MKPAKLYGPALLQMPIGFLTAPTLEDQIDLLYEIADDPKTTKAKSMWYLGIISKIRGTK